MKNHFLHSVVAIPMLLASAVVVGAQTGTPGKCDFYTDFDYGGGHVFYPGGYGAYLMPKNSVPAKLKQSNTLADFKMVNSPEAAGKLSSAKVGPGCTAGWVTPSGEEYGYTESSKDVRAFGSNTNDKAVAVYCICK